MKCEGVGGMVVAEQTMSLAMIAASVVSGMVQAGTCDAVQVGRAARRYGEVFVAGRGTDRLRGHDLLRTSS